MLAQIVANAVVSGALYAMIALGFTLMYQLARFFHFECGALYTLAAYFVYLLAVVLRLSMPISVVTSLLAVGVISASMEALIFRSLRKRRAGPMVLFLSSLGILISVENVLALAFSDTSKMVGSNVINEGVRIVGARLTHIQLVTILVCASCYVTVWVSLRWTTIGRKSRAIASDPDLAVMLGVNVDRVLLLAGAVGGMIVGGAGILSGLDTELTPTMGQHALLMGIVAVILGGIGNFLGAACGAFLVGALQHMTAWLLSTQWQDVIVFALLIIFLLLRPHGFFGRPLRGSEL